MEEVVERTGLHRVTVKSALGLRKHQSNGEIRPATRMAIQRALQDIRNDKPQEAHHAQR